MQELINELVEKTGISPETAEKVAGVVVNFVKSKLPEGLADKVEGLMSGNFDLGSMFGDSGTDNPLDKLKGLF